MTKRPSPSPGRICVFDVSEGGQGPVVLESIEHAPTVGLVATNGEERWEGRLHFGKISELLASNAPVTRSEWEFILDDMFNQRLSPDIVVDASIVSEQSLTLTVRKQTGVITQRIGAITIPYDIEGSTDVVAWCAQAARSAAEAKARTVGTTAELSDLKAEVKDLKKQLDELIQAKQDDEAALLHKFRDLLNEKKVKIREQHKIISSASSKMASSLMVDPEPSQAPAHASESSTKRKPTPSRATKRKVTQRAVENTLEDDGFDNMDIDTDTKVKDEPLDQDNDDPEAKRDTTTSEQETASEEEDDDDDGEDGIEQLGTTQQQTNSTAKVVGGTDSKSKQMNQPPPPRSLPFSSKNQPKPSAQHPDPTGSGAGSDTESDDGL